MTLEDTFVILLAIDGSPLRVKRFKETQRHRLHSRSQSKGARFGQGTDIIPTSIVRVQIDVLWERPMPFKTTTFKELK